MGSSQAHPDKALCAALGVVAFRVALWDTLAVDEPRHLLICFSPRDRTGKDELLTSLAPLTTCAVGAGGDFGRGAVCAWSTDDIAPGAHLADEFVEALDRADAALLLLSAEFFA